MFSNIQVYLTSIHLLFMLYFSDYILLHYCSKKIYLYNNNGYEILLNGKTTCEKILKLDNADYCIFIECIKTYIVIFRKKYTPRKKNRNKDG